MQPKTMDDEQVDRAPDPADARVVRVELTPPGQRALARLSALHRDELRRTGTALIPPDWSDLADGES
jgi:DNA-binding MarR family transcriptional regulator